MQVDNRYTTVTELPGQNIPFEQLKRLSHRYHFALEFCKNKDVLEVACGGGMGLGYLARMAKRVVGVDINEEALVFPKHKYKDHSNVEVIPMDAQELNFPDMSFDVVIIYEAIYYLNKVDQFIAEAYRVLRKEGILIIATANPEWADFNPSPFSIKYYSASELEEIIKRRFPEVNIYGAFSTKSESLKAYLISYLKRTAVRLKLMPKTMHGKEILKKIFFGKLNPLPDELKGEIKDYVPAQSITTDRKNISWKVLYALAYKRE